MYQNHLGSVVAYPGQVTILVPRALPTEVPSHQVSDGNELPREVQCKNIA